MMDSSRKPTRTILWLLIFCLGFAPWSAASRAEDNPTGRRLALLVGVKKYQHAQLTDLKYPENDVEELGELLRRQNFQVVVLTTQRGARNERFRPTAANVRTELAKLLENASKFDLALVGLAGHGIQPLGSDKAYFCPQDANPTIHNGTGREPSTVAFPDKLVSLDALLTTLDESGIGQKLLLVDACRNDPGVRGRRGVERVKVSALPAETGVLLSCSSGQFAFEHESWGNGGHGAFFAAVISGLSGRAAPGERFVTWDRLVPYVREQVPVMVRQVYGNDGGEQRPNLIANISEAPAVLATLPRSRSEVPAPARSSTPKPVSKTPKPISKDAAAAIPTPPSVPVAARIPESSPPRITKSDRKTSTPANLGPGSVMGTTWKVNQEIRISTYHFRNDGTVLLTQEVPGSENVQGRWKQSGNKVSFDINDYSYHEGVITGNHLEVKAYNKGKLTWTWSAEKQ